MISCTPSRSASFTALETARRTNLVSWKIAQAYYFDPTFGGALVPGTRNVFQALDSITPFAFADEPRHFSPIDSDLVISPGGIYDAEVRLDFDTVRHRITTAGTLLKLHPTQNFNFTVAHFSIDNTAVSYSRCAESDSRPGGLRRVEPPRLERRGGFSYDVEQNVLQNQFVQVSYNGSCCGISLEYRRLSLGRDPHRKSISRGAESLRTSERLEICGGRKKSF